MGAIYNKFGGVGGFSPIPTERLCYVEYVGKDATEIPTIQTIDYGDNYSNYLSYSSSTKKFTVLQPFFAYVTPWVYTYKTAQQTTSPGQFFINNTRKANFSTPTRYAGSIAGDSFMYKFSERDTFYNYTPNTNGYPQQHLKVYKVSDAYASEWQNYIDTYSQFIDEENTH